MAINIKLSLVDIDFNNINLTLVDGLSLDKLKIRYLWLFNAVIENAVIGEDDYGLVWYSGNWIDGEWYDGTWYSGEFRSGVWRNGNFYSYNLKMYDIINGNLNIIDSNSGYSVMTNTIWENGNFYGGTFGQDFSSTLKYTPWSTFTSYDPSNADASNDITNNVMNANVWKYGNFYDGVFYNSIWYSGNWYGGTMTNIQWINGKFYSGTFTGYVWYSGDFLGGDFLLGDWYGGNFSVINPEIKSRFGCTTDYTPISSTFEYVYTDSGNYYALENYQIKLDSNISWLDDTNVFNIINQPLIQKTYSDSVTHIYDTKVTNKLVFNYFNFSIPTDCVITGLEVNVSAYKDTSDDANGVVKDIYIVLSKDLVDDATVIQNKANNNILYNVNNSGYSWNFTYGGSTDLWNQSWTPDDINTTNFNLKLQYSMYKNNNTDVKMYITGVQVKIYYNQPKYTYNYNKCIWHDGNFNNGEFYSGLYTDENNNPIPSKNNNITVWKSGNFNNGKWYGGIFESGTWKNGEFYTGTFGKYDELELYNGIYVPSPIWLNGDFYNGYWVNGTFVNGNFYSGLCKYINIIGGNIGK
jgi:predicted heme/steroid binding protein